MTKVSSNCISFETERKQRTMEPNQASDGAKKKTACDMLVLIIVHLNKNSNSMLYYKCITSGPIPVWLIFIFLVGLEALYIFLWICR